LDQAWPGGPHRQHQGRRQRDRGAPYFRRRGRPCLPPGDPGRGGAAGAARVEGRPLRHVGGLVLPGRRRAEAGRGRGPRAQEDRRVGRDGRGLPRRVARSGYPAGTAQCRPRFSPGPGGRTATTIADSPAKVSTAAGNARTRPLYRMAGISRTSGTATSAANVAPPIFAAVLSDPPAATATYRSVST